MVNDNETTFLKINTLERSEVVGFVINNTLIYPTNSVRGRGRVKGVFESF